MTRYDELLEALRQPVHAPADTHSPIDGSCQECPWPLHAVEPESIAHILVYGGWVKLPETQDIAKHLESLHFDGTGCGINGSMGCSMCFGPSPMSAKEVVEAVLKFIGETK
ncbi:MAG: hypothetical protein ACRC5T_03285 [Cetobacterium sp.]